MEFFWGIPSTMSEAERRLYFRGHDEPDYGKEVSLREGPWRFLPATALLRVFQYLDDDGKVNASLTCKSWADMFDHPTLWYQRTYRVVSHRPQNPGKSEKILPYAKRFGKYLRDLRMYCEHPTYSMCKRFQKTATELVGLYQMALLNNYFLQYC